MATSKESKHWQVLKHDFDEALLESADVFYAAEDTSILDRTVRDAIQKIRNQIYPANNMLGVVDLFSGSGLVDVNLLRQGQIDEFWCVDSGDKEIKNALRIREKLSENLSRKANVHKMNVLKADFTKLIREVKRAVQNTILIFNPPWVPTPQSIHMQSGMGGFLGTLNFCKNARIDPFDLPSVSGGEGGLEYHKSALAIAKKLRPDRVCLNIASIGDIKGFIKLLTEKEEKKEKKGGGENGSKNVKKKRSNRRVRTTTNPLLSNKSASPGPRYGIECVNVLRTVTYGVDNSDRVRSYLKKMKGNYYRDNGNHLGYLVLGIVLREMTSNRGFGKLQALLDSFKADNLDLDNFPNCTFWQLNEEDRNRIEKSHEEQMMRIDKE